jgi:hypothetical protein
MLFEFVQYVFPNGKKEIVSIEIDNELYNKGTFCKSKNIEFGIECNPNTQMIYMDTVDLIKDEMIKSKLCPNGPKVPIMVKELIEETYDLLKG